MEFKIKKNHADAILPIRATESSVGYDVYSVEECLVPAKRRTLIDLGFSASFDAGYVCDVRSRSGLSLKEGVFVLNSPGTIDPDYRGSYGVILYNTTEKDYLVMKGQKIAQLVFHKVEFIEIKEVEELDSSERGEGGFGSTGK